jgi:hypothetical protein
MALLFAIAADDLLWLGALSRFVTLLTTVMTSPVTTTLGTITAEVAGWITVSPVL